MLVFVELWVGHSHRFSALVNNCWNSPHLGFVFASSGFPWSWKILEKKAVMESDGKVLEYENFPKSHGIACSHGYGSFLVFDCHACCETQS